MPQNAVLSQLGAGFDERVFDACRVKDCNEWTWHGSFGTADRLSTHKHRLPKYGSTVDNRSRTFYPVWKIIPYHASLHHVRLTSHPVTERPHTQSTLPRFPMKHVKQC